MSILLMEYKTLVGPDVAKISYRRVDHKLLY